MKERTQLTSPQVEVRAQHVTVISETVDVAATSVGVKAVDVNVEAPHTGIKALNVTVDAPLSTFTGDVTVMKKLTGLAVWQAAAALETARLSRAT